MADYQTVILFSLIGGIFSLIGGLLLLSRQRFAELLADYAMPFAAGSLLAAVFLDLLKEGLEQSNADTVLIATLIGIVIFFFAERFLHWFHHHHEHEDKTKDPTIGLILAGDLAHNALDGIAIAAAFLISVPTGIVTTIAVAAHEIPQEIGDFGLLLAKGMSRGRVLFWNVISSLATTIMAVIAFGLGSSDKLPIGWLLGISAGFLLYIAMSDIIPTVHQTSKDKKLLNVQPFLLILGALLVGLAIHFAHQISPEPSQNPQTYDACRQAEEDKKPGHEINQAQYECYLSKVPTLQEVESSKTLSPEQEALKQECISQKTKEYRSECAPYYHLRQ